MLEQVGFPISEESGTATASTSLHQSALPLEFSSNSAPRLSSITPIANLTPLHDVSQPHFPGAAPSLGDLCFPDPSSQLGSQGAFVLDQVNHGSHLPSGHEAVVSTRPSTVHWVPPMAHLNPYFVFGSRQNYESYIPRVASPLRNAVPSREPRPEQLAPQIHAGLLSRRASFTVGAPSKEQYDESWDPNQRPIPSSQPAAQLSHYFPSGNSPVSSQTSELSSHSVETPPGIRDVMPQPRNLPFRQPSSGSTKESPSKLISKESSGSACPRPSAGSIAGKQGSGKATSQKGKRASHGKISPGNHASMGTGSSKLSKKRTLASPTPRAAENKATGKSTPKKPKTAKASESRVPAPKPRSKPNLKPSKSPPRQVNHAKDSSAPQRDAILKESQVQDEKATPSVVLTQEELQNRISTSRRVTRKALRDAGGTVDQLVRMNAEEIVSLPGSPPPTSSSPCPANVPNKTKLNHLKGSSLQSVRPASLGKPERKSSQKASKTKRHPSRASVDSPKETGDQETPMGQDCSYDTMKATMHESSAQGTSLPNSKPETLKPQPTCSGDCQVTVLPQRGSLDQGFPGLDMEQFVLIGDDMLKEVNKATSTLLDQFTADVESGGDEDERARYYLEQLHVARRDKWHALLLEQRA